MNTVLITILAGLLIGGPLYRLRGGWLKTMTGTKSTQLSRAVWAIPTAAWIMFLWGQPWLVGAGLTVSVFLSMALLGHGAHMIYDRKDLLEGHWVKKGNDLELLTFWLPWVFGSKPDNTWETSKVFLYHMIAMSFIGLVRNTIAVIPVFFVSPLIAAIYSVTGLLHGPLYRLGFYTPWKGYASEVIVGSVTWATIALLGSFV